MKAKALIGLTLTCLLLASTFACFGGHGSAIPPSEDHPYWEHFGKQPPVAGALGVRVTLNNNEEAANPTWSQLRTFIEQDDTDELTYSPSSFVCADFAAVLHNNAEEAGIMTALVAIHFQQGEPHALNAFRTVDAGLVFIDCTGPGFTELVLGESYADSYDKVAYVEIAREFGVITLDVVEDFSYEAYEQYMEKWDAYHTALDQYNDAIEAYNADVGAYNRLYDRCGGYATPGECQRLSSWHDELERRQAELDNQLAELERQKAELGGSYWKPQGVVESIEIWW
jgi:hypothetical protein